MKLVRNVANADAATVSDVECKILWEEVWPLMIRMSKPDSAVPPDIRGEAARIKDMLTRELFYGRATLHDFETWSRLTSHGAEPVSSPSVDRSEWTKHAPEPREENSISIKVEMDEASRELLQTEHERRVWLRIYRDALAAGADLDAGARAQKAVQAYRSTFSKTGAP